MQDEVLDLLKAEGSSMSLNPDDMPPTKPLRKVKLGDHDDDGNLTLITPVLHT